ncbi:MAG: hypothetical protein JWP94_1787 [Mucilaginibacter sp.]|nr:hypothetical protein [Mucilaginibacter sp.]
MHKKYFLVVLILLATGPAMAQSLLKGTVYESGSNNRMPNVFIRNNNNKQITITDNSGNFSIKAETGNLIIFDSPGFISDTLYLIDLTSKKVVMVTKTIALREVSISSTRQAFDPHKEYPEIYTKSKVYIMSPTSWFSKEGRDARKLKRYFVTEEQQRHVDAVFTRAYVGSIVPLKGRDLEDFMTLYRPSYAFIRGNNSESLAVYINDSYKKYQALPPEKRHLPALTSDVKSQQ